MLAVLTTALALSAMPTTTEWESDYGKALAQTRSDSRPLLIVLDKPGSEAEQLPAELLDTGAEKNAAAELLGKYDLCHVDASSKYGQAVAERFGAKSFPYFAIIDKSGSVILHQESGQVSADNWQATLTKHQAGERAARRVTVAKPVVTESQPVVFQSQPTVYEGNFIDSGYVPSSSTYSTPVRPYCPNCQRR